MNIKNNWRTLKVKLDIETLRLQIRQILGKQKTENLKGNTKDKPKPVEPEEDDDGGDGKFV